MRYAKTTVLLGLLALAAAGCFSTKPSGGRQRQLDPDQEVGEPQVPQRDSVIK